MIFQRIKNKINSKLKQNCYECENYKLVSVSSTSESCVYKCKLKNKCDKHNMSCNNNFVKCKDFKYIKGE